MKYTELKTGDIYYCDWMGDGSLKTDYIMRKEEGNGSASHMMPIGKTFSHKSGGFYGDNHKFREATLQEIEHFLQCEKAGRYVEYRPELIEYSVY